MISICNLQPTAFSFCNRLQMVSNKLQGYIHHEHHEVSHTYTHKHMHMHMHTHTTHRFMALWILSGTTRVSRYQKKHSPTHTYRGHQSSLLPSSTTIHGILLIQSTHLTVFFHNLSPSFLWSTSWPGTSTSYSIHYFTNHFLFAAHAHTTLLHSTPLTGRAIKPQRQGQVGRPIAQP